MDDISLAINHIWNVRNKYGKAASERNENFLHFNNIYYIFHKN